MRHRIPYGDSSVVIRTDLPTSYAHTTTATLTIRDEANTALQAAPAASPKDIGTLAAAVNAGKAAITLAGTPTTAPVSGDLIRILASSSGAAEDVVVAAYNPSTQVVTLESYLKHDHAAAAVVYGRRMTSTVDCSSASDYPAGRNLVIEWGGFDTDEIPFTEEGEVEKRRAQVGDIEGKFAAMYAHYYSMIEPEFFDTYATEAYEEIREIFMLRGRDIDTLVASHNIEPLWMAQIAYSIAYAGGDDKTEERAAMTLRRNDLVEQYGASTLWHDADQDGSKDDLEEQAASRPWPRRRI